MNDEIDRVHLIEELLGIPLPSSYARFLSENGSALVNGLPILGLPISPDTSSVWGATELLKCCRPDLMPDPKYFVAIRLLDTRALCLDLRGNPKNDAPLVEIYLNKDGKPPERVHESFNKYIIECSKNEKRIERALKQLEKRRQESGDQSKFNHKDGGKFPRSHRWRTLRSCVHDQVVGLTAIRYNRELNGLLIDVFIATDHPSYEAGNGVRALTMLILSDAYRNGGSMRLTFTSNVNNGKVPDELVNLATQLGISLEYVAERMVPHEEASNIFASLIGLPSEVKELVHDLEAEGDITIEGISYVIAVGIWTLEEATWILKNSPRPMGIIFGNDLPESRLRYLESVSYGRAALILSRIQERILEEMRGVMSEKEPEDTQCLIEIQNDFCILKSNKDFSLPWLADSSKVNVQANQPLRVLPRPLKAYDESQIETYIQLFQENANNTDIRILLVSAELRNIGEIDAISKKILQNNGIYLLIPPITCSELDDDVDNRMARARLVRK